jgi:hypothetical protein
MDLAGLKDKLRSLSPLELLKNLKEVILAFWSNVFSLPKGLFGHHGGVQEDDSSPLARKKKIMLFGLVGVAVLLIVGIWVIVIVENASKSGSAGISNIVSGPSIPSEDLFYPREPDFLPDFLPEREMRRFWTLDDIRPYWKAPGNSVWWMEEIISTVDSLMEGVP